MANTINKPELAHCVRQRVTKEERRWLFGLIKWWVVVKTETIGEDIHIETQRAVDNIYLNGEKVY